MKSIVAASSLAVALAATPALANFYPTFPVSDSVWPAGTEQTISWKDNGAAPNINTINSFKLELQTGTDSEQVTLAVIGTNLKGSDGFVRYTIPPSVGPSGKAYFLRFTPSNGDVVWSTRFTLTDGTGTFPPTVKLPPGSTVGTAPSTSTSTSTSSAPASSPTSSKGSSSSSSSSSKGSSTSSSGSSSASSTSSTVTVVTPTESITETATSTSSTTKPTESTADSASISVFHGAEAVLSSVLLAGVGAIVAAFI